MKFHSGEFVCSECNDNFQTASSLLKHFACHAVGISVDKSRDIYSEIGDSKYALRPGNRKIIPDLHPIVKNIHKKQQKISINPLIFCEATLDDYPHSRNKDSKTNLSEVEVKKYKCTYCHKHFKYSTDLKRHTFIHTGERPYKCKNCFLSFNRKFLLQKHLNKTHKLNKGEIPDLKPIYLLLNRKLSSIKKKGIEGTRRLCK